MVLSLVLAVTPTPTPTPENGGLKPGLSYDQVTPGTPGFIVTFLFAVAAVFLIRSMNKRLRRIRYRAMLEQQDAAARGEGPDDGDGDGGSRPSGDGLPPGWPADDEERGWIRRRPDRRTTGGGSSR